MKNLPIGKYEFQGIIEGNYIYIDKTESLVNLAKLSVPVFLSRPRRFGKSLTVSTFEAMFTGKKELFKNTYAYHHWDFEKIHPVIRLDLSTVTGGNKEELSAQLLDLVLDCAEDLNIEIKETPFPEQALRKLIKKAGTDIPVVILIDEYDAPLLDNLQKDTLPQIKELLRGFYKIIKASEKYIRFVFITGISKFTQVGVFSALNTLSDISLNDKYSTITGYTKEEIEKSFPEYIAQVRKKLKIDANRFWEQLKHYYNGYSWNGEDFVYNPFSILNFFENAKYKAYWMATGSPSFIIGYVQNLKLTIPDFENLEVYEDFLEQKDLDEDTPESFLTQAGYLTIKGYEGHTMTLGFPNFEVKRTFSKMLIASQYSIQDQDILDVSRVLTKALEENNTKEIVNQIKIVYSSIPYMYFDSNKNEHFYSATLLMYLQAAGFDVDPERIGNKGRLDLSLKYKDTVYLFELKNDKPKKAIQQIIKNNYAGKYQNNRVIKIGLQIDFNKRNVIDFLVDPNPEKKEAIPSKEV